MQLHELKCINDEIITAIAQKRKPMELRFNDRDFKPGDIVLIRSIISHQSSGSTALYNAKIHLSLWVLIQIIEVFPIDFMGPDFKGYVLFSLNVLSTNI